MKKITTKKILLTVFSSFIGLASLSAQVMLKEIPLEQQIEASSLVVEGKVISKESFWNAEHTEIYTVNTVEVYKVFKGEQSRTVEVVTPGGIVGDTAVKIMPNLNLNLNDVGVFTLYNDESSKSNTFKAYSGVQGFYKYNLIEDVATNPFNKKEGIQAVLYKEITNETKVGVSEVLEFSVAKFLNKTAQSKGLLAAENISFSEKPVTAGTGEVLAITGTDFGTEKGKVGFANTIDGGESVVYALDSQVLTWKDTEITVEVPSLAGTGAVTIVDANEGLAQSDGILTVSYAVLNYDDEVNAFMVQHYGANGGAFVWNRSTSLINNAPALASFTRAFENWRCETGINWVFGDNTSVSKAGIDGLNVIGFSEGLGDQGYLGLTTLVYKRSCNGDGNWVVAEIDMVFADLDNDDGFEEWYFGENQNGIFFEIDFESVALHELGHAQLLDHVNDNNDAMDFNFGSGQVIRTLNDGNKEAGHLIQELSSTNVVCEYPLMATYKCTLGIDEDVLESSIELYPNPAKNEFFIKNASSVNVEKVMVYDVNGRLVSKVDVSNNSGLKTISLSGVSSGLYFVNIHSDITSITKKLVVK
ncbi:T9SS type A sorting domain-containing protein [Algibacter miyuki]|uniref:T9SS type A sorting domain-containing protein n=1 Tax=Algibacter miyuki TaxID=1306933 RepID=A0ABV5GUQ9_9FLAO|nr:T9SS type A sorting domain-containing protein [Algibacter miyuki]MDN3664702.1 T9SS type A sorting domain-containing protein [Algibacter miyuki]